MNNNQEPQQPINYRQPAVAGQFYSANPEELKENVLQFIQAAQPVSDKIPKALIIPHAGYIYSGPIAASAYVTILALKSKIKRVILLGPAHRVYINGLAYSSATHFLTPLGRVKIDREAIAAISGLHQVILSDQAHAQEHSLEVHLPFLQTVLEDFSLVPLVVGDASPQEVAEVLAILWGGDETLIVISSDLSHYHDYETACKLDKNTTQSIENFNYQDIKSQNACGCRPICGLLHIAKEKNLSVNTLDLRNSGDTAGTRDRVVGYGAYGFYNN